MHPAQWGSGRKRPVSEDRKALLDLRFLERVRTLTLSELEVALRNHSGKKTPRWKAVAIRRAIARIRPMPLDWVLGLHEVNLRELKEWQLKEWMSTLERIEDGR